MGHICFELFTASKTFPFKPIGWLGPPFTHPEEIHPSVHGVGAQASQRARKEGPFGSISTCTSQVAFLVSLFSSPSPSSFSYCLQTQESTSLAYFPALSLRLPEQVRGRETCMEYAHGRGREALGLVVGLIPY